MMFELLVKCVALIPVIHGLRAVCERIGPRLSGLILGLPSSTAIVLFLCGRERGAVGVAEMAEASLLGLVAAVALPLAYAQAVRRGWRLPGAIGAAIAAYFIVASGLGSLHQGGPWVCLGIALGAILLTSVLVARIEVPSRIGRRFRPIVAMVGRGAHRRSRRSTSWAWESLAGRQARGGRGWSVHSRACPRSS